VTLRTRELPDYFGAVSATIKAKSDAAFRRLITRVIAFYSAQLFNRHWGEQIRFGSDNTVRVSMVFQGLNRQQAASIWQPFWEWVSAAPEDFSFEGDRIIVDVPARDFWNADALRRIASGAIIPDGRPEATAGHFLWTGDRDQVAWVLHGYRSAWLPASLLDSDQQSRLVDVLMRSTRHWSVSLHFNKGLAGAPSDEIAAARNTAINPCVLDAFALAIIATGEPPAFPNVPGHQPHVVAARQHAQLINQAATELLKVINDPGSYVSESDFFERSWQRSFWGTNYARLSLVKEKYDPDGLFFVHHGVGSEDWSADGFERVRRRRT
jgi:hypothetical protein